MPLGLVFKASEAENPARPLPPVAGPRPPLAGPGCSQPAANLAGPSSSRHAADVTLGLCPLSWHAPLFPELDFDPDWCNLGSLGPHLSSRLGVNRQIDGARDGGEGEERVHVLSACNHPSPLPHCYAWPWGFHQGAW